MKKNKPQLITVKFRTVTISNNVSIPITIKRDWLALAEVDRLFTSRRITGSIVGRPHGVNGDQPGMLDGNDGNGDVALHGVFDVHGYCAKEREFTATLILHIVRLDALKFTARNGQLRIDSHEAIPAQAPKPKEPAKEEEELAHA